MERLEFYILVSQVCFARLDQKEKIDVLIEVAEVLKEEKCIK